VPRSADHLQFHGTHIGKKGASRLFYCFDCTAHLLICCARALASSEPLITPFSARHHDAHFPAYSSSSPVKSRQTLWRTSQSLRNHALCTLLLLPTVVARILCAILQLQPKYYRAAPHPLLVAPSRPYHYSPLGLPNNFAILRYSLAANAATTHPFHPRPLPNLTISHPAPIARTQS